MVLTFRMPEGIIISKLYKSGIHQRDVCSMEPDEYAELYEMYRRVVRKAVDQLTWEKIVHKATEQAEAGNSAARLWLTDLLFGGVNHTPV